jgi:short-subunit dehydrogenase
MSFRNIVITGASAGIGAALARAYAAPGIVLGLVGRDAGRLAAVADEVAAVGALAVQGVFDLRDRAALAAFLGAFDDAHPIDLLIANAGVLDGSRAKGTIETAEMARDVIEINLLGAIDTAHGVLGAMRARKRGSIVLVASLAALSPLPDAPAYSASKAGLLSYGRALRVAAKADGVNVSVVCPGYVTSRMTQTHIGAHPMEIGAEKAARLIVAGIARGKAVIGFPWPLYVASLLSPLFPEFVTTLATRGIRFHVSPHDTGRP